MYIHTQTASYAPNYQMFETAQYITGPTVLLHGEPGAIHTFFGFSFTWLFILTSQPLKGDVTLVVVTKGTHTRLKKK